MVRIGVISDTHNFFDPRIPVLFEGVDHILHGGDVGTQAIIVQLEQIAPVTAVLGNTDVGLDFRETEVTELAGRKFLVHHVVDPRKPAEAICRRIVREGPDAVVFGHTHKPFHEMIGGTLFFNPGYAGKPRFKFPRTVAILQCDPGGVTPEFLEL